MPEVSPKAGSKALDFGLTEPGDFVLIVAGYSRWYLTRTKRSAVTSDTVRGVFIQTSVEGLKFASPDSILVDRFINVGDSVRIDGYTTRVITAIFVNGETHPQTTRVVVRPEIPGERKP